MSVILNTAFSPLLILSLSYILYSKKIILSIEKIIIFIYFYCLQNGNWNHNKIMIVCFGERILNNSIEYLILFD